MKTSSLVGMALVWVLSWGAISQAQAPAPAVPSTGELKPIVLDPPDVSKGEPVLKALKERKSTRELTEAKLSSKQLSELLWAADGVNRAGGNRTAPSAHAKYPVDIYVVLPEGVYLYEPAKHQLVPVVSGDHRKQAGGTDWEITAPVNLIYVADFARFDDPKLGNVSRDDRLKWSAIEAGCMAQSTYLYCASAGLGATVRVSATTENFGKAVPLRPTQAVLCGQTIGVPK